MAEQLSTSQIRDLRDAAERADKTYQGNDPVAFEQAMDAYERKADPTTVKALCDALLAECERTYTSELPTVSGWYWNTNVAMIAEPVILYVDREQDKVRGYGSPLSMWNEDLWSGPLTPPQQAGAQTP